MSSHQQGCCTRVLTVEFESLQALNRLPVKPPDTPVLRFDLFVAYRTAEEVEAEAVRQPIP